MIAFILLLQVIACRAATVKQFDPETSVRTFKQNEKKYLKEDGTLLNTMDVLNIVERKPWNGKKAPIWDIDFVRCPHYHASNDPFMRSEREEIVNTHLEYMKLIAEHSFAGTLGRMPEDLGGDKQFEAPETNYEADRVTIDYEINNRIPGWRTVAWAFPGEVVTLKFPKEMNINTIRVGIGKMNGGMDRTHLSADKWFNIRMPIDTYEFELSKIQHLIVDNEVKIGSPIGGNVYICTPFEWRTRSPFKVRIENAGRPLMLIYGQTTNKQWEEELKNAPGNVVEMRTPGARLIFVKSRLPADFDPEFTLEYWYRAHSNADQIIVVPNYPIAMFYDQRVDAGAAVAFVGGYFTQHPSDWATPTVDKNGLINSGAWGSLHEFNHHNQNNQDGIRWGINPTGESTNNALNLVQYIDYSNIAGQRHNVVDGWNWVADSYETLKRAITKSDKDQLPLQFYATIVHAFGSQYLFKIMNSYKKNDEFFSVDGTGSVQFPGVRQDSPEAFCYYASKVTQRDMRYACKLWGYTISKKVDDAIANMKLSKKFYPVANKYCMYYGNTRYGRPYVIPGKTPMIVNFTATTAIDPNATNIQISFSKNPKGEVVKYGTEANVFKYTPDLAIGEVTQFKVTVKYNTNGESVTVELGGEFMGTVDPITVKIYRNITSSNVATALEEVKTRQPNDTWTTSTLSTTRYDTGEQGQKKAFITMEGNLNIKKAGYYTLFTKADDQANCYLTVNGENITIAEITWYMTGYSVDRAGSFKTLNLPVGSYHFTIHNYNGGGVGYTMIGYCYHGTNEADVNERGCKITDIGDDMVTPLGVTDYKLPDFELPAIRHWRPKQYLTHDYRTLPVCESNNDEACFVNCTQLPEVDNPNEHKCSNMFDRNSATHYHSDWRSKNQTWFPTTYEFAFKETLKFNYFYAHFRRDIDSWGNYTIYGKKKGDNDYKQIQVMSVANQVEHSKIFEQTYECDSVKVVVETNGAGNKYVNVQDLYFGLSVPRYANYSKTFDDTVQEISGFQKEYNIEAYDRYLVKNTKAGEGKICFNFKGRRFGLFGFRSATAGKGTVTVDSNAAEKFDMSYYADTTATLYYYKELNTDTDHHVCVQVTEGFVNIDVVGFDTTLGVRN